MAETPPAEPAAADSGSVRREGVATERPGSPDEAPAPAPAPPARPRLDWLDAAALALSSGLAAGFSFFELTTRSLWIDEATTWGTASQHGSSLWHWLVHDGGNMLGYYAVMHVVVTLFGSSTLALRLPTALAVVATVPSSYLLVRRLFDRRAAVFAGFLVAASFSLVFWGQQARGYLPGVAFSTAGALALVVAVQDRRRWAWVAFVACSVLAAYMVLLTSLVVVAQLAALALLPRRALDLRRLAWSGGALVVAAVPLAAAVVHRGSGQLDWISAPTLTGYQEILRFMASGAGSSRVSWAVAAACVAGLAVGVVRLVRRGRSPEAFAVGLLVVWIVMPFLLLMAITAAVQPVMVDRYTLPLVPAVSMLAAVGCSRLRPAPLAWAAVLALVVVRSWQLPPSYGSDIENWSGATSFVAAHLQPHDCVGFFVADGFTAFAYYAQRLPPGTIPEPVLPTAAYAAATPFVLDPATVPADRWPAVVAGCPRLWLVLTHQAGRPAGPGVPSYQAVKYVASQRLDAQLATAYTPMRLYKFTQVAVVLYDRRV